MVVRFTSDVFCDFCGCWMQGPTSTQPEKKKALAQAKKKGWKHRRGKRGWMIDVCPECQKEKKE